MNLLSPGDFREVPWRNGRGTSLELYVENDGHGLCWRLTRTAIVEDGPFSDFSGYDRHLLLLGGGGVTLEHDDGGVDELKNPLDMASFSGDCRTWARLLSGPVEDFNVMVRRDFGTAIVLPLLEAEGFRACPEGQTRAIYAVRGCCRVRISDQPRISIPEGHLLMLERKEPLIWTLDAEAAVLLAVNRR